MGKEAKLGGTGYEVIGRAKHSQLFRSSKVKLCQVFQND